MTVLDAIVRAETAVEPLRLALASLAIPKLICRNVGSAVAGNHAQACHTAGVRRYQPADE